MRAATRHETVVATLIALLAVCVAGYTAYIQAQQVRARGRWHCALAEQRVPSFIRFVSLETFRQRCTHATEMGHWRHSTVLFVHYRRAVTRRNAQWYWNITPIKTAKVVPMVAR